MSESDSHSASGDFHGSNTQRLSARGWGIAVFALLALWFFVPRLAGPHVELAKSQDFRIPFALSEDYSLFREFSHEVGKLAKSGDGLVDVAMLGDSVIWGEYVAKESTWSSELTRVWNAGKQAAESKVQLRVWNFGLNGSHPAALRGLIELHGKWGSAMPLMIHFNPLWLTSPERDLSTSKPVPFNHSSLTPQFGQRPPVYKADAGERLRTAIGQRAGFLLWAHGFRIRHLEGMDWNSWAMEHPRSVPWSKSFREASQSLWLDDGVRSGVQAISWEERRIPKQRFEWVDLEKSYQWGQFLELVQDLQAEGTPILIVLGPLNPWVMSDLDLPHYNQLLDDVVSTLKDQSIPHWRPEPPSTEQYGDTSHPLAAGYTALAEQSLISEVWKNWISELIP